MAFCPRAVRAEGPAAILPLPVTWNLSGKTSAVCRQFAQPSRHTYPSARTRPSSSQVRSSKPLIGPYWLPSRSRRYHTASGASLIQSNGAGASKAVVSCYGRSNKKESGSRFSNTCWAWASAAAGRSPPVLEVSSEDSVDSEPTCGSSDGIVNRPVQCGQRARRPAKLDLTLSALRQFGQENRIPISNFVTRSLPQKRRLAVAFGATVWG